MSGPEPTGNGVFTSYLQWSDQGKADIWRYCVGAVVALFILLVLAGVGMIPFQLLDPDFKSSLIESNIALLSGFLVPFILVPLMVQWLHKRPYWSVGLPMKRFEGANFGVGFGVGLAVGLASTIFGGLLGLIDISYGGFDWGVLLPLAIVGFVGIFIQAGAEEIVFRGYLTQFMYRLYRNPFFFVGVPALLFAMPHIANVAAFGGSPAVLVPYLLSGLLYGWAAYRSGSLWMSLGLHLSNNWSNLVLVGTEGDVLKTTAPLVVSSPTLGQITVIIGIQTIVTVLLLEWMLRRRPTVPNR